MAPASNTDPPGPFSDLRISGTDLRFPSDLVLALGREWSSLAQCGTMFSGAERIAIASLARSARNANGNEDPDVAPLRPEVERSVRTIARTPVTISDEDLERWEQSGLNRFELIEITGIVARLSAVDMLLHLHGLELAELPTPGVGRPSRQPTRKAKQRGSRLPTTRPGVQGALSGVNAESEAHLQLHRALAEPAATSVPSDLSATQREFVAIRTSIVNECVH